MTDLKWTPVTIRLGEIEPWSDNPRMSTKAQAERLIQSERELGQVQTVAVGPVQDNGKHPLYDGHQRVSAWFTIKGADFELTALQSNRPLTEDERRKMAVLLHTATGGWNWDKLSGWRVGELKEWGLINQDNVKGWNLDALNVREILNDEGEPIDYQKEWEGMPEYNPENRAFRSLVIHFETKSYFDDFVEFIKDRINQGITEKTKSLWYPKKPEIENGLIFNNES